MITELASLIEFPDYIVDKLWDPENLQEVTKDDLENLKAYAKVAVTTRQPWEGNDTPEPEKRRAGREALSILEEMLAEKSTKAPKLSSVFKQWMETKPYSVKATENVARRAVEGFIKSSGDIPVDTVTPLMFHRYAESMKEGSRSTLTSKLGYVKTMLNWAVTQGFISSNPWLGLSADRKLGAGKVRRSTFTPKELTELFSVAASKDPQTIMHLSILITTGMRLNEAAFLDWEDVKLNEAGIKFFDLRDAKVKTEGSRRMVPVPKVIDHLFPVGITGPLFPEYKRTIDGAASNKLMPVIRVVTEDKRKVVHSLRHTFKDLARDAGISKEVGDFITGHSSGDAAGSYGSGPSLAVRQEALDKIKHPWLI